MLWVCAKEAPLKWKEVRAEMAPKLSPPCTLGPGPQHTHSATHSVQKVLSQESQAALCSCSLPTLCWNKPLLPP